ncbi:lysosomal alpha-mannosidase-like isoform X2 [Ischnura elegans]|uniref:lysosomal alpha-mannosidase-like isoform X2 n=1 Tax=Ischnura elegans TaxID=197161 RepID=UPI001ED8A3C2|nr:lysosomal alpha-mannosidase-like isoform X2 [Ischnura elegans]
MTLVTNTTSLLGLFLLLIGLEHVIAFPAGHHGAKGVCGYESCPKGKPGMLNVHLIAHTHDDVGWLKTVDQYYFGSQTDIQNAGVQYILDSVVQSLLHDPNKKFIYVETAFFWKWWMRQHDSVRHQVKTLISNGQLEFVGGGWSMNDEAVTNYMSTIDQMTWGFRKLNDTFGECGRPKVGWQIDPFGHSRDMASTFALMGFDGLFFARLDYTDKSHRLDTKSAEMVWKGSPNLGKKSWLFTGVLYNHYMPPPGFCFDLLCDDEPIMDDKHSPDYNVDDKVNQFIAYAVNQSNHYATDNIVMTMGEDFQYQDANMWFSNLDKLIRYVNERQETEGSKVNVFYSTPSCYLKSLNEANITWPDKSDDFFPYASDPHSYWTGYFSSRPTIKYFERLGNNFLQVCKQLYVMGEIGPEDQVDLDTLREAMGVMQHHDAITGTERQKVAQDYARILYKGFEECGAVTSAAIQKLMNHPIMKKHQDTSTEEDSTSSEEIGMKTADVPTVNFTSCLLLNISQCDVSEGSEPFMVTVYNPLSKMLNHTVRIPVSGSAYVVKDPSGAEIGAQVVPIPKEILNIPGRVSSAINELVFDAELLPAAGFKQYTVTQGNKINGYSETFEIHGNPKKQRAGRGEVITLGKGNFKVGIGAKSGLMEWIERGNLRVDVKQEMLYYEGMDGDNLIFANRASGAYIFRPNGTEAKPITSSTRGIIAKVHRGEVVDEIHQQFSDWTSQVVRVHKDKNYVEVNWVVGPIPISDGIGKEVIMRYTTNIQNGGVFFTDSNGREMLERKRRASFDDKTAIDEMEDSIVEPIAGNYYPVTSRIRIRGPMDGRPAVFSVLTDRAQGGSSIKDGQVELMVHRRLLHDDGFGVGEALNEKAYGTGLVARGRHIIMLGPMAADVPVSPVYAEERQVAQEMLLAPWLFFSKIPKSYGGSIYGYAREFVGLRSSLPPNLHVLTLEPWTGKSVLFRLEHFYEKDEDSELSKPVTLNLKELLAFIEPRFIRETTLGANQWLENSKRMTWSLESNNITENSAGIEESAEPNEGTLDFDPTQVVFGPMDIRTFIIGIP